MLLTAPVTAADGVAAIRRWCGAVSVTSSGVVPEADVAVVRDLPYWGQHDHPEGLVRWDDENGWWSTTVRHRSDLIANRLGFWLTSGANRSYCCTRLLGWKGSRGALYLLPMVSRSTKLVWTNFVVLRNEPDSGKILPERCPLPVDPVGGGAAARLALCHQSPDRQARARVSGAAS